MPFLAACALGAAATLAVPLLGQLARLKQIWLPVMVALVAGSSTAIVSAVLLAWALGGLRATGFLF